MDAVQRSCPEGVEVICLTSAPEFFSRPTRSRDPVVEACAMLRLASAALDPRFNLLDVLAEVALEVCQADSAGISVLKIADDGARYYQWDSIVGRWSNLRDTILPPAPLSACAICLARDTAQSFVLGEGAMSELGLDGETVTDGLLLPWHADEVDGTFWVLAHGKTACFDRNDLHLLERLASFTSVALSHRRVERHRLLELALRAADRAAAITAQELMSTAHPCAEAAFAPPPQPAETRDSLQELTGLVQAMLERSAQNAAG